MYINAADLPPFQASSNDWAHDIAKAALPIFAGQLLRGEKPSVRMAYVARPRPAPDQEDAWCTVCNVRLDVRRVHLNVVRCSSCGQRFIEEHEGTIANEELRRSPGYPGPRHGLLSAAWWEWTLRQPHPSPWPDGALAFDVVPFELPTRRVEVGTKKPTKRVRRRVARSGFRGRRGSKKVGYAIAVYRDEVIEHECFREPVVDRGQAQDFGDCPLVLRYSTIDFRRHTIGVGCKAGGLGGDFELSAVVYLSKLADHLMAAMKQGLTRALLLCVRNLPSNQR